MCGKSAHYLLLILRLPHNHLFLEVLGLHAGQGASLTPVLRVSCPSGSGRKEELTTSLASRISRSLLIKAFSAASALFFQMVTSDSLPDSKLRILCRWCKQHKTPHHSHPPPPTSPVTGHPHSHTYMSHLTLTLTCHPSPSHITSHPSHPDTSHSNTSPSLSLTLTCHPSTSHITLTSPVAPVPDSAVVPLQSVQTGARSPTAEEREKDEVAAQCI